MTKPPPEHFLTKEKFMKLRMDIFMVCVCKNIYIR